MAVLERDALKARITAYVGDRTGDEDLSFLEDLNDTFDNAFNSQTEDWKSKYEENDSAWRKRYAERFRGGGDDPLAKEQQEVETDTVETKTYAYEDLFKEG